MRGWYACDTYKYFKYKLITIKTGAAKARHQERIHAQSIGDDSRELHNCSQCEMMCSYELTGVFNAPKSRIKIFAFSEPDRNVPFTCTQCEEAWVYARLPRLKRLRWMKAPGRKSSRKNAAWAARFAPLPAPSAPLITISTAARSPNVISAAAIRPALKFARRMPFISSMLMPPEPRECATALSNYNRLCL